MDRTTPLSLAAPLVLAGLIGALASSSPASAQHAPRRPRTVGAAATSLTGVSALGSSVALYLSPAPRPPSPTGWRGGVLFDDRARGLLRIDSPDARDVASRVSDVLLAASLLYAAGIDATAIPLAQGDPGLALAAHSAHSLALGITLGVNEVVKHAIGRARPLAEECVAEPQREGCEPGGDAYASFYSGHTAMAFTSAGFSCAMHLGRGLLGDPAADIASCAASIALASGTGLLRMASDRHYLTDVLVGALVGTTTGVLVTLATVPERGSVARAPEGVSVVVVPMIAPTFAGGDLGGTIGLSASGTF